MSMNRFKLYQYGVARTLFGLFIVLCFHMTTVSGDVYGQTGQQRVESPARAGEARPTANREIFVASNGWHSAIFVARSAIPRDAIPVISDFPKAVYLGFGWGDAAYFPERDPGILTLLSAALQPTPSVLHVTGLSSHPRDAFPKDEVIGLALSTKGFSDLIRFLYDAFARDGASKEMVQAPGLHTFSKFYRAKGEFHLFNNCNSWTARGLAAAGLPIKDDTIFRAEGLMSTLRNIAQ